VEKGISNGKKALREAWGSAEGRKNLGGVGGENGGDYKVNPLRRSSGKKKKGGTRPGRLT